MLYQVVMQGRKGGSRGVFELLAIMRDLMMVKFWCIRGWCGGVQKLKRFPAWFLCCVRSDCVSGVLFKGGGGKPRDVYLFCGL